MTQSVQFKNSVLMDYTLRPDTAQDDCTCPERVGINKMRARKSM